MQTSSDLATPLNTTTDPALASTCVRVDAISHYYGERQSLREVSFDVRSGEIFGLLGPNGSGKTTLFRILATLLEPAAGNARVFGVDLRAGRRQIRARTGVVFQAPALDGKLSAAENLYYQGQLFGMHGRLLRARIDELLEQFGLRDRAHELAESFSGGMQRRLDLARAMLHRPELLILDEPTTGLDPGARRQFWSHLETLRDATGVTLMITTHIMTDAEHCDRLGIMSRGRLEALDTPEALRQSVGGDVVVLRATTTIEGVVERVRRDFDHDAKVIDDAVRIERPDAHELLPRIVESLGGELESVTLSKPTLEDAYIHLTGHRFEDEA